MIVRIAMIFFFLLGTAFSLTKEEVLRIVCPVDLVRTKDGLHCPVCPYFTTSPGAETNVFYIEQVLVGRFVKGKTIAIATYWSRWNCESGADVGGYIVLVKREHGYELLYGKPKYLGSCRVVVGVEEDKLMCSGQICKLDIDGLECKPLKKR